MARTPRRHEAYGNGPEAESGPHAAPAEVGATTDAAGSGLSGDAVPDATAGSADGAGAVTPAARPARFGGVEASAQMGTRRVGGRGAHIAGGVKPPSGNDQRPPDARRRQTHAEVYLHFVWSTRRRGALVTPAAEEVAFACIASEVEKAGCELLAIGGMPDHVHVGVRCGSTTSPAGLAKRMKGASSQAVRREVEASTVFGWQDGYGVFSFSRSHLSRVVDYIRYQKRHHAEQALWAPWEVVDEADD